MRGATRPPSYPAALRTESETMHVDETTVRRIARLARIKITDEEAKSLEGELSQILNWVEQLDEIDTSSVEPMTRVVAQEMKQRPDKVTDGEIADDVVKNAPVTEDHYFVVPKVVE
jgi:aspartyl-tRNA(Asn)/glutamyl-tRNA(Gln) amidotransferase subunit C